MKSPTELLDQMMRAGTALHLKLLAQRKAGKPDIGGREIDGMIEDVDQVLASSAKMLNFFRNEDAARIMMADTENDAA